MNFNLEHSVADALKYVRLQFRGNRVKKEFWEDDPVRIPILLIHGFLGTRGVMYALEQRLKAEGYPVFSVNLGFVNIRDIRKTAFLIHRKVEEILYSWEIEHINIVAHSMGGLIGLRSEEHTSELQSH